MSLINCCTSNLDSTELYRVRHLGLGNELNHVKSIVVSSLERSCNLTNLHRVNLSSDIAGQSTTCYCNTCIGNLRLSLTGNFSRNHTTLQLLLSVLHSLHQGVAVSLRGYNLEINIFDVAALGILTELLLQLAILSFQVSIGRFYLAILDAAIRQNSQLDFALLIATVKSHLCRYGVRQQTLRQQTLVLAGQNILT